MKFLSNLFIGINKKKFFSWAFYDFANSSYALLILSFVFPIYFKEVIVGVEKGDFYWGLIVSISILLGGLIAPIIGAIADYDDKKKQKFIFAAQLAIIGSGMLYFTDNGTILLASLVFIIANIGFEIAQVLYDSFLNQVAIKEVVGRASGFAWGFGYIGGVSAMLLLKPLYENGYAINSYEFLYKLTFPLTALFFLLFSLPAFIFLKDNEFSRVKYKISHLLITSFKRISNTVRNFKDYKNIGLFLLGFYFLSDALVTLFAFIALYGRETFMLSFSEVVILLLIVQIIAFPSAIFFGWLSDKKGSKKILLTTTLIWCLVVILLTISKTKILFYIIAFLSALVIGSSQAIARSWYSKLVPEEKRTLFFGFSGFSNKIAATAGPFIFGTISVLTSNQRFAMLSLLPFFMASFLIFLKVKE